MTPLFSPPPPGLTADCNAVTAGVHLVMAFMAIMFFSVRRRRIDALAAGLLLVAGGMMHVLGGLDDIDDARWVMIVRTFLSPFILWGWYRLLRAAAGAQDKVDAVERVLAAKANGPDTQRLIDARELLERINTPTPVWRKP